jgi:hypothetical protein
MSVSTLYLVLAGPGVPHPFLGGARTQDVSVTQPPNVRMRAVPQWVSTAQGGRGEITEAGAHI